MCGPIGRGLTPCFICPRCLQAFPSNITQAAFAMTPTMTSVSMQASRQKSPNRPDLLIGTQDHPASWCHGSHPNKGPFCPGLKSRIRMSRLRLDKTRFRQAENPAQTRFSSVPTKSRLCFSPHQNVGTGLCFELGRCYFVPTKTLVPTDVGAFFRGCGSALAAPERLPRGV